MRTVEDDHAYVTSAHDVVADSCLQIYYDCFSQNTETHDIEAYGAAEIKRHGSYGTKCR
jgi:hypothetical protein